MCDTRIVQLADGRDLAWVQLGAPDGAPVFAFHGSPGSRYDFSNQTKVAVERVVHLADGHQVAARAVIVATEIAWRRLGVPRLEALVGSGVFYGAAASETLAMAGRVVFVVGAGNSAGQTALHLARHARRVNMLVRGESLERRAPSRWPLDRAPLPLETSMPGVFATGDVRYHSIKRVASAVGDGATAVRLVHEYLAADRVDELSLSAEG